MRLPKATWYTDSLDMDSFLIVHVKRYQTLWVSLRIACFFHQLVYLAIIIVASFLLSTYYGLLTVLSMY